MWLRQLGRSPVPVHAQSFMDLQAAGFPAHTPSEANIQLTLVKEKGDAPWPSKVLFWASDARVSGSDEAVRSLRGAECAYGAYENIGVAKSAGRKLVIRLRCPIPYLAQTDCAHDVALWCRHLHYVAVEEASAETTDIGAVSVFPGEYTDKATGMVCKCEAIETMPTMRNSMRYSAFVSLSTFQDLVKNHGAVGISALAESVYTRVHKTDVAVDYRQRPDVIVAQVTKLLKQKRAGPDATRTPVVVYCAKPSCSAARQLMQVLIEHGICNVFYFKGGVEEAREQIASYADTL